MDNLFGCHPSAWIFFMSCEHCKYAFWSLTRVHTRTLAKYTIFSTSVRSYKCAVSGRMWGIHVRKKRQFNLNALEWMKRPSTCHIQTIFEFTQRLLCETFNFCGLFINIKIPAFWQIIILFSWFHEVFRCLHFPVTLIIRTHEKCKYSTFSGLISKCSQ